MIDAPVSMEDFLESLENVITPSEAAARLFVVSDIHSDYEANMEWCRSLADGGRFLCDTLIVAGDVSHSLDVVRETLQILVAAFDRVWFVPGNHDLWVWTTSIGARGTNVVPGGEDSLSKLRQTMELCAELGVHTAPGYSPAVGVIIVPLLAWHHLSWDTEPEITGWRGIPPCEMVVTEVLQPSPSPTPPP
jgi:hypothetical protein